MGLSPQQLLGFLIENGTKWILEQRNQHRPFADELPAAFKDALKPYFQPETLEAVRIREVPQIENPGFYDELRQTGQEIPLDFSRMAGITFVDTVVLSQLMSQRMDDPSLIFHECVHVAQYRVLGIDRFTRRYVEGWAANGYDYFSIPLERDAYELQGQFETSPGLPFSVEAEVARRLL